MAEETKDIKIETSTDTKLPSIKNGVWIASVKEETLGMNWFKHCGFGKINATRTILLAVQGYTMVHNKLPSFVCCFGWAYNGGSTKGLHEITKFKEDNIVTISSPNLSLISKNNLPPLGNNFADNCAIFS